MEGRGILYKKMKRYFQKYIYFKFYIEFSKNYDLAYKFCGAGGIMIYSTSGERGN